MPAAKSDGDQSAVRSILLNTMGVVLGLILGVPPALGASTLGLPWLPYGISAIVIGLVIGLLIAFLANAIFAAHERSLIHAAEQRSVWRSMLERDLAQLGRHSSSR